MGGGIGGFVSDLFGSKNEASAGTPQINHLNYAYGGNVAGADEAANRYRQQAEAAQGRQGEQVNYGNALGSRQNALGQRENALQARGEQGSIAAAMKARAFGGAPLISQMQGDRQMGQAVAAQASQQASARGAGAIANAQRNAANNTANAQSAISNQTQINAAHEQQQNEQNALGAFSGMRAQDLGAQGADMGMQGQDAQMAQAQSQFNAQQRAQNDQYDVAKSQQEMGVRGMQLGASQNFEAQQSGNALGTAGINAGVAGQNAGMNQQNALGVVGMGMSAGGMGMGMGGPPKKAGGGPVEGRKPYLVGEQGPELIVPEQDGHVIPAPQTAALLGQGAPVGQGPSPADAVVSTWGTGRGITPDQLAAQQGRNRDAGDAIESRDWDRDERAYATGGQAIASPLTVQKTRDEDAVALIKAKERNGVELTEDDDRMLRTAGYRLGEEKKASPKKKEASPEQKESPPSIASRMKTGLGDAGAEATRIAGNVDTRYHAYGGYQAPNLIPVGVPRAMGGPVEMGGAPQLPDFSSIGLTPVSYGSGGGVQLGGAGISGADVRAASTGLAGGVPVRGMVGGGGITGGGSAYAPREEGGPVQAGGEPKKPFAAAFQTPEQQAAAAVGAAPIRQPTSFVRNDSETGGPLAIHHPPTPEALAEAERIAKEKKPSTEVKGAKRADWLSRVMWTPDPRVAAQSGK